VKTSLPRRLAWFLFRSAGFCRAAELLDGRLPISCSGASLVLADITLRVGARLPVAPTCPFARRENARPVS
jgi:hypothetical protein